MKRDDCKIPFVTQLIGWLLIGIVLLYFFKESFEYPSWKYFLEKQGSLIGAILGAIVLAATVAYTIKRQSEGLERQVSSNRERDEINALRSNVDKANNVASRLGFMPFEVLRIKIGQENRADRVGMLASEVSENTALLHGLCCRIDGELVVLSSSYKAVFLGLVAIKMNALGLAYGASNDIFLDAILTNKCHESTVRLVKQCKARVDTENILGELHDHLIALHKKICQILECYMARKGTLE